MNRLIILIILIIFIFPLKAFALEDAYHYIYKGDSYFWNKDYDKALLYYKKALELDPKNIKAVFQIGNVHFKKRLYEQAANTYMKVLKSKKSKNYTSQINSRAMSLTDEKEYKLAEKLLKKVINVDPKLVNAHINLGYIYSELGNHSSSLKPWLKAYELSPSSDIVLYDIGYAYHSLKKYELAMEYYKKCLKVNSKYVNAYVNMADIFLKLKQYDKSIEESKKVLSIDKNNFYGHFNLAEAKYLKGQVDEALKYFLKTYDLKTNDIDTLNYLAEIYISKKMHEEAKTYIDQALKIDPKNKKTKELLLKLK